jgi:hypothetical protein
MKKEVGSGCDSKFMILPSYTEVSGWLAKNGRSEVG